MEVIQGKSIYAAIALGKIQSFLKQDYSITRLTVSDIKAEVLRFESALQTAKAQLQTLYNQAISQVGNEHAQIFEIHMMMLEDDDYLGSIYHLIRDQKTNAEYAIRQTSDNFSTMFASMDDEYMQARSTDVIDISDRLLSILFGTQEQLFLTEPVILMADDLSPSETIQLDKTNLLALVLRHGSANSHTAILARTMGIPALVGIDIREEWNGQTAIVNGHSGQLILSPSDDVLTQMTVQMENEQKNKELLKQLKGKETITKDGKKINLYANIGHINDCKDAISQDAEGIGLMRSEFIYMEASDYPSEEEQFQIYKTIAESMAGKKVIIRTLDIGADKQADYFKLDREENPAMGLRAIRVCLTKQDVFKTQLRAILRASVYGNISIMLPMIISLQEIQKAKDILHLAKNELNEQSLPYKDIDLGIMIETPAAVMISDLLAEEVDFFSIGTNDLSQYTLAIDRQNHLLDPFFDSQHEAILRMIEMTVKNGHDHGIWVGICGELAADPRLTERFIKIGVDELSVSPSYLLGLRKQIRDLSIT